MSMSFPVAMGNHLRKSSTGSNVVAHHFGVSVHGHLSHLFGPETRQDGKLSCSPHGGQEAKKEAGDKTNPCGGEDGLSTGQDLESPRIQTSGCVLGWHL